MKRAFVPKRGAFLFADYSQIEPRMFAYFASAGLGDPTIADWYREGRDVYVEIAARALKKAPEDVTPEERQDGKVWFLMSLYGAGPRKVAAELGIPYDEAKRFYLAFHDGLPQIKGLSNPRPKSERAMRHWEPGSIERIYASRGFLRTPWGRHLHAEQWGEHKLLNKLIQGSAADYMKAALLAVNRWQREHPELKGRAVAVIHDELIFDLPPDELPTFAAAVPELMARPDEIAAAITEVVPIAVELEVSTTNWAEKTEYEEVAAA